MEKAIFIIGLGICLIELVVIFALLNKKKPMHAATLIAITFGILGFIDAYQIRNLIFKHSEKNIGEKKAEQIAAEKAEQMYYEEMFPELKMNLVGNDPFIIIPAYNEMFILRHPELKKYFVREVSPQEIFSTKLNIDFSDGTW